VIRSWVFEKGREGKERKEKKVVFLLQFSVFVTKEEKTV